MKLTSNTRRLGLRAGRLLTLGAVLVLGVFALSVSSFSFELRAKERAIDTASSTAPAKVDARVSAAIGVLSKTQEPVGPRPTRSDVEHSLLTGTAQERAQAACDAGHRRDLESIPQLISMLSDESPVQPLRCWTEGRWNPALDTFKHSAPGEQAAIALASMGSPAFEPLTNALSSGNATVRRNAAWAIGELTNMGTKERIDAVLPLIGLLSDGDGWVRRAAARALGELRDERAGERLTSLLLDSEPEVRQTSAWALGEMKDERAVQTLCVALISDVKSEVRLAAAEALGEIRSQKAIASLNQALNDVEPLVRKKARWAIEEIEDSDG